MKIIFLCGTLEPGCDGVGDYVRRLASELVQQGHEARLLSISDRYCNDVDLCIQENYGIKLHVLRLPFGQFDNKHLQYANNWINSFDPNWISLQYVPFSFNPKGLPFGLSSVLRKLWKGKNWHVMFHELWLGMDIQASMKIVCWGWVQRIMVLSFIKKLKPSVVHTQSSIYKNHLADLGVNVSLLPLFGNIAPISINSQTMTLALGIKNELSIILFGGIHEGAPVLEFTQELDSYSKRRGCQFKLIIIGRCGPNHQVWVRTWKTRGLNVEILGEQSSANISEILQSAYVGITTTPLALVEKSGTVAAMREHGLPIICVARPWQSKRHMGVINLEGISEFKKGQLAYLFDKSTSTKEKITVSSVSKQFLKELESEK